MNLNKHIDKALSLYQEAFSRLDAWERERRTMLEKYRENAPKFTEEAAREEYFRITNEFKERLKVIVEALDNDITIVEKEYMQEVASFYLPNGSAIDTADQALLASGILTSDELDAITARHTENPTMLRIIGKYARETNLSMSPQMESAVARAANGGESERRIWKAFKQTIHAPVRMAEQGNAGTAAFMNSALKADEYAAEAKAELQHIDLYMNEANKCIAVHSAIAH